MKSILTVIVITAITSALLYPQWKKLPIGTGTELLNLHFVSPEVGWVVGRGSTILKTTDGGLSWIAQQPEINGDFTSVFFVDEDWGWVGGYDGQIIFTSNGGKKWVTQNSDTKYSIESLFFTGRFLGYAAVNDFGNRRIGYILQTTDGGVCWEKAVEKNGAGFIDIHFEGKEIGWAIGSNGLLYRTTDSGSEWIEKRNLTSYWLFSVFFRGKVGWAVGGNSKSDIILKTTDGGLNWNKVRNSNQNSLLAGSFFLSEDLGWVCGENGVILRTNDGGKSWRKIESNTSNHLWEIFFVDNTGYIVGDKGTVLKYTYDTANKKLELLSPAGGEQWKIGSVKEILWKSEGITDIRIEYSFNNGASWNEIAASYPSTGIFEWTVSNILTHQARIRLIDLDSIRISSECKKTFSIVK